MRFLAILALAALPCYAGECLPISEAPKKIGAVVCIRGEVVKVAPSRTGTHFLNFCTNWRECPFNVVVFAKDLRQVGDVRQLQGKTIEIHGKVRIYSGRPEMILSDSRQLSGEAAKIPPLPKNYDVERKGRYSVGQFPGHPSKRKKSRSSPSNPPETEPGEPEDR